MGNKHGNKLLDFDNVSSNEINIDNCVFEEIQDTVIAIKSTNNIRVRNNCFKSCYRNVVCTDNSCRNTIIIDNIFRHCGRVLSNSFCVICKGANYYIANNDFKDFGYCAIGVGVDIFTKKIITLFGYYREE